MKTVSPFLITVHLLGTSDAPHVVQRLYSSSLPLQSLETACTRLSWALHILDAHSFCSTRCLHWSLLKRAVERTTMGGFQCVRSDDFHATQHTPQQWLSALNPSSSQMSFSSSKAWGRQGVPVVLHSLRGSRPVAKTHHVAFAHSLLSDSSPTST